MRSGSQGWIRVSVIDERETVPAIDSGFGTGEIGGMGRIYGPGTDQYLVHIEEGKHQGEVIWVPKNYVEIISSG